MEDIKVLEGKKETSAADNADKNPAATNSGASAGQYKHVFSTPFKYEDKVYKDMTFDFESLTGSDIISIESEMAANGEYVITPEVSSSFLYRLAAKAAKVGSDVIEHMPISDFVKIRNKSRDFLISTGF